jgi:hypothetical protein
MALGVDVTSLDRTFPRLRLQQIQGGLLSGKHLDALIQRSHADLYLAGDENGRIFWPWRVLAADEVSMPNRESCSYLVVDSVFSDPDWGNRDTLEKASDVDADAVILADVYHDPEATVKQVLDGLNIVDDHTWSGDVFLPVQPPVDTSIRSLLNAGVDATAHKWALGGLKDASDDQRIAAARRAREELGEGPHLHGLGFGVTDELASALRDSPDLLDSVDSSTSVQNAIQETTAGEQRLSAVGALAGADLIAGLRKLSSCVETNQGTRTTLADFQ